MKFKTANDLYWARRKRTRRGPRRIRTKDGVLLPAGVKPGTEAERIYNSGRW